MTGELHAQLQRALGTTYRVDRELGGGGMARVFLATETALDRPVVLKILPPELAQAVSTERFRQEIRLAARLQHPHIVALLAAGEADGLLYYTMPYIEGESLRLRLAKRGELPVREALRVLRDLAAALAYAHDRGVVHRDIKPDNVLLSDGEALVTDFGVAKALSASATDGGSGLTSLGVALGTPAYMAPEQAAADPHVDHRADIYAFGCVAYEVLTGQAPFTGRSAATLLAAHATEAPESIERRRPALPPVLALLVMRCLEKRPADRPQSGSDLLQQLEGLTTPSGGTEPTRALAAMTRVSPQRHYATRALVGTALIGLVFLAALGFRTRFRSSAAGPETSTALPTQPGPSSKTVADRSVAVLPFQNISADKETDYFSDGMTDELITALGKVEGLRVPARTSAFAFKGKTVAPQEVGRTLNVTTVLEGSVRRSGNRLRVSAQLVSAHDGFQLWGETYDRQLKDVFAVQDEIAHAIVSELTGKLSPANQAPMVRPTTKDLGALDLYLQGRALWARRGVDNLRQAARLFQSAIAKDSGFARAYAALAEVYAVLPDWIDTVGTTYWALADTAARRALALDSALAEAHAARGYVGLSVGNTGEAERELRQALALNPSYATAHKFLAQLHTFSLNFDSAAGHFEQALALDPLSLVLRDNYAELEQSRRRYDRALELDRDILNQDPTYGFALARLAWIQLDRGHPDSALAALASVAPGQNESLDGLRATAYARLNRRPEAESILAGMRARPGERYNMVGRCIAFTALGETDSAIACLKREGRSRWLSPSELADPLLDPLRRDPRFIDIERRSRAKALRPAAPTP
jgi:eukaryotic-like serine/threonine-protein kinase